MTTVPTAPLVTPSVMTAQTGAPRSSSRGTRASAVVATSGSESATRPPNQSSGAIPKRRTRHNASEATRSSQRIAAQSAVAPGTDVSALSDVSLESHDTLDVGNNNSSAEKNRQNTNGTALPTVSHTFSRGNFVFTKSGSKPFWPARVLTVDYKEEKCQVFLYGLHVQIHVSFKNTVMADEEAKLKYRRPKHNNSRLKDEFTAGMLEFDLKPEVADHLLQVAAGANSVSLRQPNRNQLPNDNQHTVEPREFLTGITTLKFVPKGSRPQVAQALADAIHNINSSNDHSAWKESPSVSWTVFRGNQTSREKIKIRSFYCKWKAASTSGRPRAYQHTRGTTIKIKGAFTHLRSCSKQIAGDGCPWGSETTLIRRQTPLKHPRHFE